jgi:hypothetical protein
VASCTPTLTSGRGPAGRGCHQHRPDEDHHSSARLAGRSLVSVDGTQAAWLLIQHADHDPAFQRACLELLGHAVHAGEADATYHAYLTDRVLLAEGKQLYRTQFMLSAAPGSHGRWLIPTELMSDTAFLDEPGDQRLRRTVDPHPQEQQRLWVELHDSIDQLAKPSPASSLLTTPDG